MNSKPWFSDGKRDIIKNPHNPHRVRCSINLYWQPVVRSSVFVYRNECLPQKQPCFPASAPVNSKMAGTDVTSYQSSSQKKSKRPHPGALILSQTPEGGEGKRGQMPHICPGSPPSGLTLIGALLQMIYYVLNFTFSTQGKYLNHKKKNLSVLSKFYWFYIKN